MVSTRKRWTTQKTKRDDPARIEVNCVVLLGRQALWDCLTVIIQCASPRSDVLAGQCRLILKTTTSMATLGSVCVWVCSKCFFYWLQNFAVMEETQARSNRSNLIQRWWSAGKQEKQEMISSPAAHPSSFSSSPPNAFRIDTTHSKWRLYWLNEISRQN